MPDAAATSPNVTSSIADVATGRHDWHTDPMWGLTQLAATHGGPGSLPRLMDAAGLTEFAQSALGAAAPAKIDARVLLESRSPAGRRRGVVLVSAGRAVVGVELAASGHDEHDLLLDMRGAVVVSVLPTAVLPLLWLRWAGPLHDDEGGGSLVRDVAGIDRRVRDAAEPVPDEAPALSSMWAGQWREWSLRELSSGLWLRYVSVPEHGVYLERPVKHTGVIEFAPRPSGLVWGDIVRAYCALPPVRAAAGNETYW